MRLPHDQRIAQQLALQPRQVAAAVDLLDAGNTVPFIARYRKEVTLNLDEFQIRQIQEAVTRMRAVDERRDTVLASIEEQGKLTQDLRERIDTAETLTELEDLYQPYRPKRRTRASIARERGLEGLANLILTQARGPEPEAAARDYLGDEVPDTASALAGARDIVAETISDNADIRADLRRRALTWATVSSKFIEGADDAKGVYATYYEFSNRIDRLRPHQILALNRGEREKVLRVSIDIPERDWMDTITDYVRPDRRSPFADQMALAIDDAAKRLLLPAIERDLRRILTEQAEEHAIEVFASNLRRLLLQPPLNQHIVMGIDPAYRTGCKIAIIDASGRLLETTTIYPHAPQKQHGEALRTLAVLVQKYKVSLIAIGNGTASRETEALVAELTRRSEGLRYVIVNEAGASVYSASDLARAELPDLDVSLRGAVSIARRLQDPLAELVKIDPKSIGVGLYQHDVDQKALGSTLDAVVESVVNQVGVDLNTASPALLAYVAGIGPKVARSIVAYREDNGIFSSRAELKKVSGLGPKAFEQSAGFLRVRDGREPLDASAIHPESYAVARALLKMADLKPKSPSEARAEALGSLRKKKPLETLAAELDTGVPTLSDIFEQLVRPGRDPREDVEAPLLRSDVLSMEDLQPGMKLDGTVRNVVDFGAFVDIGVKQDGLLHISQIPRGTQLGAGDIIAVSILNVDQDRGRIGLGWVEE